MRSGAHRRAGRAAGQLLRVAGPTAVTLGLVAFAVTGSPLVAASVGVGCCIGVVVVLAWVGRRRRTSAVVPDGALWAGPATVRVCDLLSGPLFDTVTVRHPTRAELDAGRGAPGDLVLDEHGFAWTANWAAGIGGVRGSVTLPWTAVVKAKTAAVPAATPGSGAIILMFADDTKLDFALAGNYSGFRATLTRLPRPIPGLGD